LAEERVRQRAKPNARQVRIEGRARAEPFDEIASSWRRPLPITLADAGVDPGVNLSFDEAICGFSELNRRRKFPGFDELGYPLPREPDALFGAQLRER
jgi:hypothetical protein